MSYESAIIIFYFLNKEKQRHYPHLHFYQRSVSIQLTYNKPLVSMSRCMELLASLAHTDIVWDCNQKKKKKRYSTYGTWYKEQINLLTEFLG